MSVAVVQSSSAYLHLDQCSWPAPAERYKSEDDAPPAVEEISDEERPEQFDIWSLIQSPKTAAAAAASGRPEVPYVHPLVRRFPSLMSQKSLEICTESLGSETGSDDFASFMDDIDYSRPPDSFDDEEEGEERDAHEKRVVAGGGAEVRAVERGVRRQQGKELTSVNYHCSIGRRSPPRSFPPPLPSISRRNGPCLRMRPHRRDGRLIVEAVSVPSQNYLHAQRMDGRLLLFFIDATFGDEPVHEANASDAAAEVTQPMKQEDAKESEAIETMQLKEEEEEELEEKNCYEEEEEEEEVEVVDRGTVVEVKVSMQPQQQCGAMKVHRSSLVINKFVGGTPLSGMTECEQPAENGDDTRNQNKLNHPIALAPKARRASPAMTTTAAAAAVAASTLSVATEDYNDFGYGRLWGRLGGHHLPPDNKLLFTSKRRNRGELLHNMRRCNQQLPWPLFIWEPCCIATSY